MNTHVKKLTLNIKEQHHPISSTEEGHQAGPEQERPIIWRALNRIQSWWHRGTGLLDEVAYGDEYLCHAEMLDVSTEELVLILEKRRLYERIALGNRLSETERYSRKLQEGR